jgi:uncharacterized protein (TIGR03435 family)
MHFDVQSFAGVCEVRRFVTGLAIAVFACALAGGQSGDDKLSFEVASVRPSGPASVRNFSGGPGTRDPERFTATRAEFNDLLSTAYGMDFGQISGPGWISSDYYDVNIKVPPGATKDQFKKMLQALLVERFHLSVHHQIKVFPVYELVIAKNGPKLKLSKEASGPAAQFPGPFSSDPEGFPVIPEGQANLACAYDGSGIGHWTARRQTMAALARSLTAPMAAGRRVIDKTGLDGKYDFKLYYDTGAGRSGAAPHDNDTVPTIEQALQQQLGLKLLDAKVSLDTIVVDHAERIPTAN